MKQEDKDLLLKDLCGRLPYGVKLDTLEGPQELDIRWLAINRCNIASPYLPYLFPLSSMTERQCYELSSIRSSFQDCWKYIKTPIPLSICNFEQIEWLHKNHFDYRGLIDKGLAIDATGLNIYE